MVILHKNLSKSVILREGIFVLTTSFSKVPFGFIGHLKESKSKAIKMLSSLVVCNHVIFGEYILNIFRTVFPKLLFLWWNKNQLAEVFFWEFYIDSAYVISHCFKNNFNAFLSKYKWWFIQRNTFFGKFTFLKFGFYKKTNFAWQLKVNVFYFCKCKQFFIHSA